jgi:DNA repair exonuclease SbcCD nuclease subunit
MAFSFIHTADWQIGKPFGGFPSDVAPLLQQARLDGIDRIALEAKRATARHVIVAGDVFDSRTPSSDLLRRTFAKLGAERDIVWHLLPGNHDPSEAGSFWHRFHASDRPSNVRFLLTSAPVEIEPNVVLLPAPLSAKAMATDPTGWMDQCQTPVGTIRIGVAHGSVQGFGSEGDAAVPIAPDRARRANLAYLALGDWHGVTRISDRAWYSGTHEPDQFPTNRPGFVLRVDIDHADAVPRVTEIATSYYNWTKRAIVVVAQTDLDALLREMAALGTASQRLLLELTLTGQVSLSEMTQIETRLDRLAPELRFLRRQTDRLLGVAAAGDIEELPPGAVRSVAARLQADALGGDVISAAALRRLLIMVANWASEARS